MIFISHAHVNKPEARRLVEVLLKFGLWAWLDEQRLDTGSPLQIGLHEAIAGSRAFIYLISREANESRWCQAELQYAQEREKAGALIIVPVRLTDDDSALPDPLADRLHCSLEDGAARIADELKRRISTEEPTSPVRLSVTVRLHANGLTSTLHEARRLRGKAMIDVLLLDEAYRRLDETYWALSHVQFPPVAGVTNSTKLAVDEVHRQSRRAIAEARALARKSISLSPDQAWHSYLDTGYLRATWVLLHRLAWNCEYLSRLRTPIPVDTKFMHPRNIPQPFSAHACDFRDSKHQLVGVQMPPHGSPLSGGSAPVPWGWSSPFADMFESEVGEAVGHYLALKFLAGNLPSIEMLDPDTLLYALG